MEQPGRTRSHRRPPPRAPLRMRSTFPGSAMSPRPGKQTCSRGSALSQGQARGSPPASPCHHHVPASQGGFLPSPLPAGSIALPLAAHTHTHTYTHTHKHLFRAPPEPRAARDREDMTEEGARPGRQSRDRPLPSFCTISAMRLHGFSAGPGSAHASSVSGEQRNT